VPDGNLRNRVVDPAAHARADHQQHARLRALVHEDVARPGRAVDEVPLRHRPLLLFHDRGTRAAQDEEVLLRLLGVVERGIVAGPDHRHVNAYLCEPPVIRLEEAAPPESRTFDPTRRRLADVHDEPLVGHGRVH
jgi:hypothetical protein